MLVPVTLVAGVAVTVVHVVDLAAVVDGVVTAPVAVGLAVVDVVVVAAPGVPVASPCWWPWSACGRCSVTTRQLQDPVGVGLPAEAMGDR